MASSINRRIIYIEGFESGSEIIDRFVRPAAYRRSRICIDYGFSLFLESRYVTWILCNTKSFFDRIHLR